jgi:predicted acylesterase/phospholipase RssA
MRQIGLALSGGGFRATLYHLGLVRYLRDAGLLEHVSHISSVSGGSVLAAHLALNWDRYCGSEHEFDEVANEVTRFIQLDVRNRIVRRYPLAAFLNGTRRVFRLGTSRQLTRSGLLESHYEKHLYGDKCLSELPECPQLHILATNVGEGSLCSFNRRGVVFQTQLSDNQQGFKLVQTGLATVSMAVAASSAFPGFFPPLELAAWDVGADEGEFSPHSFTDGGVFDNLGIRMFRWIEQSWMQKDNPLSVDDFVDIEAVVAAIHTAASSDDESPVCRIASLVARTLPHLTHAVDKPGPTDGHKKLVESLWGVIENHRLYEDPSFLEVRPTDPASVSLLQLVHTTGRPPDWGDHLMLNRQLLDLALQRVIGHPCFHSGERGPKAVIVSDAGKKINSLIGSQSGGLIQTAIRSSEILMDRVWQLEKETFKDVPGFVFASINDVVMPSEDRFAISPVVQQQVARVRTDLDYFDDLEIRSLAQHGYCVARKTCRSNPEFFGNDLPDGPSWDPTTDVQSNPESVPGRASESIAWARRLQKSSRRKIWSTMFSFRDWPTYVWVPLILLLLFGGPYIFFASQRTAQRNETVLTAVSQGKQIEVQITAAVRSLQADASFMSELPPIQGIIDAKKRLGADTAKETGSESEEVWRERLEEIFEGLLHASPAYLSGAYLELDESGGREIVRVERYTKESALVHTVPVSRLAVVTAEKSLGETSQLLPGEVKAFCTELNRTGQANKRFPDKRLIAAAAVHDADNEDFFGIVVLELDLESTVGTLLAPASESLDTVYITDQEGVVLLNSDASSVGKSSVVETNIVTLVPQTAGFLALGNQAKMLTDQRSFVALKTRLDPDNPASAIGVVIRITP